MLSKKVKYIVYSNKIEIINYSQNMLYRIKNSIINRINTFKCSNYLKVFILGNSSDIEEDIYNSLKYNGIIHLFSVSGMHIGLISSFIIYVFNKILKFKYITVIILLIIILFYIFLTNYSISIIRTSLLIFLCKLNKKYKLGLKNTYILFYIFFFSIIYNPYYVYNTGFIFSYVISFFLIKYSYIINSYNNIFSKLIIISIISFLSSVPILINTNYSINFLSIILNIFFSSFISLVIFPLSLLTFIFSFLEPILLFLINIFEKISLIISNIHIFNITLCKISYISILLYYLIIIFIINNLKRKKYMYIAIIIFLLLFHHYIRYFDTNIKVIVINVGQGDSILLELPYNKNILIDIGGNKLDSNISKNIIIPFLQSEGIYKLDYLISTHGDADHMGEAINLVENFKVEKVIFNCGEYNNLEKELIKVLDKKKIPYYSCIKELNINNNKLYFLQTKLYDNENDNSNVIYTKIDGYKFMFMGDAGIEKEKDILEKYNISNIDVLKVGHHGSKTSSGKSFINEIKPNYSIISVGKNNRYGHPNKEVLNTLEDSKIYRTDQDGSIMFKVKNNKLKIETCSP